MHVFQLLSGIKEKLDKMMQSNYSCVVLLVKGQKVLLFFLIVLFLPDFKFLKKCKIATMFGDVTDLQQYHHALNVLHLVEKVKGFPLKAKSK